ncbi:MAG: alpha-amylase family glycosyl hydrolase [Flavisolibacter sp.]
MNKDWIYTTNIYEINLRQYTKDGTIKAFSKHLNRLKGMGVETLWFMPLTPISEKEKKGTMGSYYACSDYTSVNPEFGTMDDFKQLVVKAHKMGFKVIIDWVANHTGWDHVWTREHPDWYKKDEATGDFKKASGMDDIIELDFSNVDMRAAMVEAMKFWVNETGIDGFRCDLAFWVELDFWMQAIPQVNELKPLFWLAEMDPLEHPAYMQVFDAAYSWSWMHKTKDYIEKKFSLAELATILFRYDSCPGLKAWFTTNHDENSWNGTEYEKYGGAALALAVHSCTWPGIPLVYSGQELPLMKRLKFFDKDVIQWKKDKKLEGFYATLLTLHHTNPALHAQSEVFRLNSTQDANVLSYMRKKNNDEVIVILNLCDHIVKFDILNNWVKGKFKELFLETEYDFSKNRSFELKGWDCRVYVREV